MRGEGNRLAPAVAIGNRSAGARREIAVYQGIVGTRISVDPLPTPAASLGDVGLLKHPLHILLGLRVRRNAAVEIDGSLTGIVCRDRHGDVPTIAVEQISEVANTAPDVLTRVETVEHAQGRSGPGHQLHEASGSLPGHGGGVERRFDSDDGLDQGRIYIILKRDFVNLVGVGTPRGIRLRTPSRIRRRCTRQASVPRIPGTIREVNDPFSVNEPKRVRGRRVNPWGGGHQDHDDESGTRDHDEGSPWKHVASTIAEMQRRGNRQDGHPRKVLRYALRVDAALPRGNNPGVMTLPHAVRRTLRTSLRVLASARGFSLIELLVVIIILGLLAGLVGPRLFSRVGQSKQAAARAQIELFSAALDQYRLDVGAYPASAAGLEALVRNPNVSDWSGPYLKKNLVPLDPWGKPYQYKCCPGDHGDFDIWSLGADGAPGGDGENADVTSWSAK